MIRSSIREIGAHLRRGDFTPSQLCAKCLDRLQDTSYLNAFVRATPDLAHRQAEQSSRRFKIGKPLGPLDGIPIAVKDNFCTTGVPTTCASRMLANYVPPYTATVVQRLQDAGAIVLGKTNMDEFAMGCGSVDSAHGPVRNPWRARRRTDDKLDEPIVGLAEFDDDFHIAGGSSGGSAAAVASGVVFGALGSDTGGSTRNPAALCGVVGLKPTYGVLSRHGLVPLVNSMDVPGIHAGSVDDAAILFNAMIGDDPLDSTSEPFEPFEVPEDVSVKGVRVGVPKEYDYDELSTDVSDAWRRTADLFANAGASVEEVSMPHTKYSIACYSVLNACEVASNFSRYDGIEYGHRANKEESTESLFAASRCEGFNDVVRSRILVGNYFLLRRNYEKYFVHAMKVRRFISEDFRKVFGLGIDVLLTPVTLGTAPLHKDFVQKDNRTQTALQDVFTQATNMAGIPAISVPAALSANQMPIGIQLMGPRFSDARLFHVAKWMEEKVQFPSLRLHKRLENLFQFRPK